jgi:hypothetical protein
MQDLRIGFVHTEIDIGLNLIRIAEVSYGLGKADRGTTAHQKAEAAYAQALRLLKELSPEDSEPLNVRLAMFRTALDRLATLPGRPEHLTNGE